MIARCVAIANRLHRPVRVTVTDVAREAADMVLLDDLGSKIPFDALRLSALRPIRGETLATLSGGERIVLPTKNPSGTQGYMVTLEGARRLLQRLAVPHCPIDTALDAYWKHGLCIPLVSPSVVAEDASIASSIEGRFGGRQRKTLGRHLARVAEAQRRKIAVFLMARSLRSRLGRRERGNPAQ